MKTSTAAPAPQPEPPLSWPQQNLSAALTLDSTDAELLAALQADADLLQRGQVAATQAFEAAYMIPSGPIQGVTRYWDNARKETETAIARAGGRDIIGTRRVEDWTARVAMLRVAMKAREHFRALVAKYQGIPYREVLRLREADDAQARHAAFVNATPVHAQMAPQSFNAMPLLADLAQRGVHLWASEGGTILARPGRALTARDREQITMHKAAILAALADEQAIA